MIHYFSKGIVNHFNYLTGTAISPSQPSSAVTDGKVNRVEGTIKFTIEKLTFTGEFDSDGRIWGTDMALALDVQPIP